MAKAEIGSPEFYKRKHRIKELVLSIVKTMDNHKMLNYNYYKNMFDNLFADTPEGDAAFDKWASWCGQELDNTVQLYHLPFEEISLEQIEKAAKILGLPLEQYIIYRHTGKPVRSSMKMPVGYVNIKRLQQILSKKQRMTLDSKKVANVKTGQSTRSHENRIGGISDDETFALLGFGAENILKEMLGPRADNNTARAEMHAKIHRDGFVQLGDLSNDISEKTMLNTLNTYLLASGIRSDLVSNDLELDYVKRKKAEELNIKIGKGDKNV